MIPRRLTAPRAARLTLLAVPRRLVRRGRSPGETESGPPRVTAWAAWHASVALGVVVGALPVFMYVRYAT